MNKNSAWLLRIGLFLVYAWFGVLKLLGLSPATQLVHDLFDLTVPLLGFDTFLILFATFEVLIGIAFLFPRFTKIAFYAVILHLFSTALPLVLLPGQVWTGFLVPTMEGQYILKNVLILGAAYALFTQRKPAR